jgi:hypothetical protein
MKPLKQGIVLLQYFSFRRDVDEICALLGYYAASSGYFFYRRLGTTYQFHLQASRSTRRSFPETSVKDHSTMRNIPKERRSQCYYNFNKVAYFYYHHHNNDISLSLKLAIQYLV